MDIIEFVRIITRLVIARHDYNLIGLGLSCFAHRCTYYYVFTIFIYQILTVFKSTVLFVIILLNIDIIY